jgi:hypothetical protein
MGRKGDGEIERNNGIMEYWKDGKTKEEKVSG